MNSDEPTRPKGFSDFFRDSKGNFSIFTVVGFFACLALIYIAVKEVNHAYTVQTEILWGFIFGGGLILGES